MPHALNAISSYSLFQYKFDLMFYRHSWRSCGQLWSSVGAAWVCLPWIHQWEQWLPSQGEGEPIKPHSTTSKIDWLIDWLIKVLGLFLNVHFYFGNGQLNNLKFYKLKKCYFGSSEDTPCQNLNNINFFKS